MSDFLTAQFTGQPALVALDSAAQFNAIAAHLSNNAEFARLTEATASMGDDFWDCEDWERAYRPYEVVDGILFVPVRGVLLHNFPYAYGNWATGYEYILRGVLRGLDDANVRGIALLCNSPGGMVAGCFEAADKIYERKGEKPIRAFAHEAAYSAAYAIASVADSIVVSKTGGVGSIGVVTSHIDLSKMYDDIGIKQTFIFAGKHKVDGNASEPLPEDVKARIQVRIDELYDVFVSSVARNRGMEEQAVRDTEALTYTATQAVSIGLADSIGPLDDAVAQFCADLSTPHGEENMTTPTTDAAVVDQAVHDQAVAAARAEGKAEGELAATSRIGAILGSEEAKGRGDLANHFAFKTSMSAEDAVAALAVSPKAAAPAAPAAETVEGGFDAAMSQGNPEVGASATTDGADAEDSLDSMLALAAQFGIAKAPVK
jgi:signal peptide peptidase SppA